MPQFDIIAFDADDTLWHNERSYASAQAKFIELLSQYHNPEWINNRLYQTEMRNMKHFGYGVKAFALSMIETAVELTEGRIAGQDIQVLIDEAKAMLNAEVELLEHVAETIPLLAKDRRLMIITKGDLLDQESKISRSGLEGYFDHIEVVSDKTQDAYARILKRRGIEAGRFLMVGNSLRSDILPILELGSYAVYVPHEMTWLHEVAEQPDAGTPRYAQIEHMGQLPALIGRLESE
jgi:putative hydrolase of the HAD superfamily